MKKKWLKVKNILGKNKFKIFSILTFLFIVIIVANGVYAASDPTLVTKLNSALKKIQGYLVKIATPAAGVAIASGVLIRKLSFGNEEKMVIGKKIIINAILGYAIIISIDLIIKFVDSVLWYADRWYFKYVKYSIWKTF